MARKLQLCGTEDEMRVVAAKICKDYLHGPWTTVDPSALEFKRISGGLSNFLYYVALPDDHKMFHDENSRDFDTKENRRTSLASNNSFHLEEPRKVLLRIYGQVHSERAMDAIVTESVIFTLLSERKLGPKLHGVFSGGRIEQYIPARPLRTKELSDPALSMKIAQKMSAIHSIDVPLCKEPNWLWKTLRKWTRSAADDRPVPKNPEEERIIKVIQEFDFEKEIEWLHKYLETIDSPIVFCHNDMQEGNILLLEDEAPSSPDEEMFAAFDTDAKKRGFEPHNEDTFDSVSSRLSDNGEPRLVIIDFEYCAYNYRGFDIANHFLEWMYDYTNQEHPYYYYYEDNEPTLQQKEIFIKEYLKHYNYSNGATKVEQPPSIEEVNQLLNEVEAFFLACHMLWCLWSIINATKSKITFGYWEFAITRLEAYKKLKQEVIKMEKYGIPQKRKICEVDI